MIAKKLLARWWMLAAVSAGALMASGCDPLCLFQPNCW